MFDVINLPLLKMASAHWKAHRHLIERVPSSLLCLCFSFPLYSSCLTVHRDHFPQFFAIVYILSGDDISLKAIGAKGGKLSGHGVQADRHILSETEICQVNFYVLSSKASISNAITVFDSYDWASVWASLARAQMAGDQANWDVVAARCC